MDIFVDTSVFIYAFTFPLSNSKIILNLAESRDFHVVVSELVLVEFKKFVKQEFTEKEAYSAQVYLETLAEIVPKEEIQFVQKELNGRIADKDLDHLATAEYRDVVFIIAYDKHFEVSSKYRTPKKFLQEFGIKTFETEY